MSKEEGPHDGGPTPIPDPEDNPLLQSALARAAEGILVIPLHGVTKDGLCRCHKGEECGRSTGKHPNGHLVRNGLKNGTTDTGTIISWWTADPDANVGAVTGMESNLVVIDVDPRNGGDYAIHELIDDQPFPDTPTSITGSGGAHYLFTYPEHGRVPSSSSKLGPGIDVKADGGYVVVPPSSNGAGPYEWEVTAHPDDLERAELPSWLLAQIRAAENTDRKEMLKAVRMARGVPEGQRNIVLIQWIGSFIAKGLPQSVAETFAVGYSQLCTPPFPVTEAMEAVARAYSRYKPPSWAVLADLPQVRSDAEAWVLAEKPRTVDYCHNFPLRMMNRQDGSLLSHTRPCDSWWHRECAERRVKEEVSRFARLWGWRGAGPDQPELWFQSYPNDPGVKQYVNNRMKKLNGRRKRDGRPLVDWLKVKRADRVYLFATEPVDGDSVGVGVETAIKLLAGVALALPGVKEVRTCAGWWKPTAPPSGMMAGFGRLDDDRWDPAVDDAAEQVTEEYGVEHKAGPPLPEGIPVRSWEKAIKRRLTD